MSMFGNILLEAEEILLLDLDKKYDSLKVLASQIFMLSLIDDERNPVYKDGIISNWINDSISIMKLLKNSLYNSQLSDDETEQRMSDLENLFYKIFLSNLRISDADFNKIFEESGTKKNIRMKNMIKEAFELFFSGNQALFKESYFKYLEVLNSFYFKDTVYMKMYFLNKIVFSPSDFADQLFNVLEISQSIRENYFQNNDDLDLNLSFKSLLKICYTELASKRPDAQPLDIILEHLMNINPQIANRSSVLNEIAFELFSTPQLFISHHRINSIVSSYENQFNLSLSHIPLYFYSLNIQIVKKPKNSLYEDGFVFEISPYGYSKSSRFSYDRIVLFGKFNEDCLQSDIFLSKNFEEQQFIIICAHDGYFICDYSLQGLTARQLHPEEEFLLIPGTIFQLEKVFIAVLSIDETGSSVQMQIFKGGKIDDEIIWCSFNNQEIEKKLGREGDIIISEKPTLIKDKECYLVSRNHCSLIKIQNGIYLKTIGQNKTWVNLKTLKEFNESLPSEFFKIEKEGTFNINMIEFRFTSPIN